MDSSITHEHFQLKKNVPELRAGDRVRVHQRIKEGAKERIQIFEGLVIKSQGGTGINGSFTVRRISLGVGVEKTFPLHLPSIVKVEKIKSAKVRRARIFYVRELIGKRANRLKKEKDSAGVWEDVIVTSDEVESEKLKVESEDEIMEETEEPKEGTETDEAEPETEVKEPTDKPETTEVKK